MIAYILCYRECCLTQDTLAEATALMTEIEDHEALEMETNGDSQEEMSPLTGDMSTQSQDDGLDDIDDAL